MEGPSQNPYETKYDEIIYLSDHTDDEGEDVHWVSVLSAKAPPESISISSDEEEETSDKIVAKKKEDRRTEKDQPFTIHVQLEEGEETIDVSVFPHFMVGQIMWLLQPKMPP